MQVSLTNARRSAQPLLDRTRLRISSRPSSPRSDAALGLIIRRYLQDVSVRVLREEGDMEFAAIVWRLGATARLDTLRHEKYAQRSHRVIQYVSMRASVELEKLTWLQAEAVLTADAVVLVALGAAAKEHGPHLRLDNDFQLAEYLKRRVMAQTAVVVAPTISYHYYPAFQEYPGSTHLGFDTARELVVDIAKSLARFGPRRFYILNTGVSTLAPLAAATERLLPDGIVLRYTKWRDVCDQVVDRVMQQQGGTHADEIETSMMLYIDPALVDMSKATAEFNGDASGGLTRVRGAAGVYSASGVYGDATLASAEKGRLIVEAAIAGIVREVERLRATPLTAEGT